MADYDCVFEGRKEVQSIRNQTCLANLLSTINSIERLSFFAFPEGNKEKAGEGVGYKRPYHYGVWKGKILEEFDTPEQRGIERWAEFLGTFVPGTSFMYDYDETPSILGKNAPMCEFRLEQPKNFRVSATIRRCWLNGVRYCYEEPNTQIAKFCLTYWERGMRPHQAFQIYLLAHSLVDRDNGHVTLAYNPYFFDETEYRRILTEETRVVSTNILGKQYERNDNYRRLLSKSAKVVRQAWRNKQKEKKSASLDKLISAWQAEHPQIAAKTTIGT